MKHHSSPLESPKSIFRQNQPSNSLQVPRVDHNVVRNLGVNFEELMPTHSDPTSPNCQKMNDFLKNPSFMHSKPISMVLPEFSQNSCIIPLQDQCLETSMPFEDLIGQLESPKLSDKMQQIFNSNVNLSESIMKNTFRAVDESRVRLEDKDLQVELEIRELKLHHLQKRVEGCLASSKNTLALNAQLSQNVSKMVSPVKSSRGVLSSNIKPRASPRLNTPTGNIEDLPSPVNYQLASNRSNASSSSKNRPNSLTHGIESRQEEHNYRSFPIARDLFRETPAVSQGESPAFKRDSRVVERELSLMSDKSLRNASLPHQDSNPRLKDNIINEAYQKLSAYYDPREPQRLESNHQPAQADGVNEQLKAKSAHHRSTESLASNNVTFYTNMPEKDAQVESEEPTKNMTRLQSNDCLSEDPELSNRQHQYLHSKSREAINVSVAAPEPTNTMPREISLVDADGKEKIFIVKPKEYLSFQKLETICITPLENNRGSDFAKQRVRSQLSSFQYSETEDTSQINEHLRQAQSSQYISNGSQILSKAHSKKASSYENSNIASMSLDKPDYKASGFSMKVSQESQPETYVTKKDAYAENLKLQILNHPKCQQFFTGKDIAATQGRSTGYANPEPIVIEDEGLGSYFKQKIQDVREFLTEFEKILPAETPLSPLKELPKKRKKVKATQNEEVQTTRNFVENLDLESKTVENTPRLPLTENSDLARAKYNSSSKRTVSGIGYLTEQSPQNDYLSARNEALRYDNEYEFVSRQLFKENQGSPYSGAKMIFSVGKPDSNVTSIKKKTKSVKSGIQKEISAKIVKPSKNSSSIAVPVDQNSEQIKRKTKSSVQQVSSKRVKDMVSNGPIESKRLKDKNLARGNSKSIVEVIPVSLARLTQRTNSVLIENSTH